MKANKSEQKALITLLNRLYREIRDIEEDWDIRIDETEFRPRIEYFHDAVRALTSSGGRGSDIKDRLSVEMLAYDISMLRYIQAEPLPKSPKNRRLSAMTEIVESSLPRVSGDKAGLKPDASVKYKLADLYKSYGVFFSALLSDAADRNYATRIEDINAEVEDAAAFLHSIQDKGDAQIDLEAMAEAQVQSGDLMNKIIVAFKSGKLKKRMQAMEAHRKLKEIATAIDKENKTVEMAHMTYATTQLAIYEGARDVIKKMAFKGFNIIGDFVESAITEAQRGGRGI
jgi:hypothetical protein